MKVKDVIDKCEELLVVPYTREDLVGCFNVVECALALDYLPLYATHKCDSNVVYYDDFEYAPIRIIGCNCPFKTYPAYVESKETITSIQYAYTPRIKSLHDDSSYGKELLKCLSYGVVSEYLISQGFYEEAILWDNKYKKEIELLML